MGQEEQFEEIEKLIGAKAGKVADDVARFARERPHAALGIALGVGWILANGVPPRVFQVIATRAVRTAVRGVFMGGGLLTLVERLGGRPANTKQGATTTSVGGVPL